MKIWLLDHVAHWSECVGNTLSSPFYRFSGWASAQYWRERRR